jgi:hypothetical protein
VWSFFVVTKMSISKTIIRPIKKNVQVCNTWKEANDIQAKAPICVVFPFNEYSEPKFVKALPGQIFTVNRCFRFQSDYYLCVSTAEKDSSFVTELNQIESKSELVNPLIADYFAGVHQLEKMPSSVILVKISPSGEEAENNIVGRRLIDVQETILSDLRDLVRRYNDGMAAIFANPFNNFRQI